MAPQCPIRRGIVIALLATILLGAGARVAVAHAFPERADPRVGSVVQGSPEAIRIWFDGELEPAFCQIVVTDGSGQRVDRGDARVDASGRRLLQVSVPPLPSGTYRVHWAVLSIDGHRTTGDFRFTVKGAQ
jgi:methionine-rich copper-binding protein CopC